MRLAPSSCEALNPSDVMIKEKTTLLASAIPLLAFLQKSLLHSKDYRLFCASLLLLPVSALPQSSPCPCPELLPPNNIGQVTISAPWHISGNFSAAANPAYFSMQVISGPPAIPLGAYDGWCVDALNTIDQGPATYSSLFWASCDPNLNQELGPGYPSSVYVSPDVWHQINYLLNHKNGAYFWNVQMAIWHLIGGPVPSEFFNPPFPPTDPVQVLALVAEAQDNAPAWQPQCGDKTAVVVQIPSSMRVVQLVILELPCTCPPCPCDPHDIKYNFNGTQIIFRNTSGGSYVWFISDGKVSGLPANQKALLHVSNQKIVIPATGSSPQYTVPVPDAFITFDPSASLATTTFDTVNNVWRMNFPSSGMAGNVFYGAVAFKVPLAGLPGGIKNVDWSGIFTTDTVGLSVTWQWHAANYSNFTSDYNSIAPKPTDDNSASIYKNSDHAGTPEGTDLISGKSWKSFVVGGASGGGGGNYTGSGSSTIQLTPCVCPNLAGVQNDSTSVVRLPSLPRGLPALQSQ